MGHSTELLKNQFLILPEVSVFASAISQVNALISSLLSISTENIAWDKEYIFTFRKRENVV